MSCASVLVVDDESQIQRVLRPSLTASGYEVREIIVTEPGVGDRLIASER